MKKIILAISIIIVSFFGATNAAFAQNCDIVYGGGQIDCGLTDTPTPSQTNQATPTATPKPKQPTVTPTPQKTQTKGGQTVAPASTVKTTPPTGPEALGLISLIPMAAAGFYLRRKGK